MVQSSQCYFEEWRVRKNDFFRFFWVLITLDLFKEGVEFRYNCSNLFFNLLYDIRNDECITDAISNYLNLKETRNIVILPCFKHFCKFECQVVVLNTQRVSNFNDIAEVLKKGSLD